MITTARLCLVLQTPEQVLAWIETLPPEVRAEVSPDWIARVRVTQPGDVWALAFNVVESESRQVVGTCAFKGPPDADGTVEIAYGIDENWRGRGLATEAAGALVKFAGDTGLVWLVCAHTRASNLASARVLAKCNFQRVGEVDDPEDGWVDRWERNLGE